MARMSKKELSEIIGRDKPGFEIVEHQPAATEADAGATGAASVTDQVLDLDELRRRYLGEDAVQDALGTGDVDATPAEGDVEGGGPEGVNDEDEIVVLSPTGGNADPWAPGPGRKSVIVSGKERRVIAEQG